MGFEATIDRSPRGLDLLVGGPLGAWAVCHAPPALVHQFAGIASVLTYAPDDSFAVINGTDDTTGDYSLVDFYLMKLDGLNTLVKISNGVSEKPVLVLHP